MMPLLSTVFAQTDVTLSPQGANFTELGGLQLGSIIAFAINAILIIAALLFFFMLIIGGIRWITGGGDKAATEAARNQITAALIGLVIVFSAWVILNLIGTIFNINITAFDFGQIQNF